MRTFRQARLLAVTGTALAALALTACDDGTGTRDEGASKTVRPPATARSAGSTEPSKPAREQPSDDRVQTSDSGSDSKRPTQTDRPKGTERPAQSDRHDPDPYSPENLATCNGANTRTTAQPVSRPLNHMLLTVTNTGSKPCALLYYPVLRFDEMQWVPQPIEDSKPQAVPTLNPGESGYAGVRLSSGDGSGTGGTTGRKLTVAFQGRTPNSTGGPSATPPLPAKGVYYDSVLSVTYWQQERESALY
ncbi:DUF4232 domain-containing protein [Streptomyces sp. NPDC088387]|uniref:DUF4232 domain-containing protein n=1 Tax=Streptomyces sp. NPDC088387 TaxID=3365859 RepID=UPI00382A4EB2